MMLCSSLHSMNPTVRVLLFSTAREAVGRPELRRSVEAEGVELSALLDGLTREYPKLGPVLGVSRSVVNGEYVRGKGNRIRPGDEVAIHPPYSGG